MGKPSMVKVIGQNLHPVFVTCAEKALVEGDIRTFRMFYEICNVIFNHIHPRNLTMSEVYEKHNHGRG